MKRITLLFAIFLFVGWANAATYLVQPGGSGAAWSGVSGTVVDLTTEAKSLNDWYKATAITSADQIWLIQGTYTLTDSIVTKSTEKIYGGFAGTEQTIGDRTKGTNAWDFTNETIIDGNALVRGIVSTTGATIDGLSIQNCAYSNTTAGNCAAAVKITAASILQNSIVRNNTITGLTTGFYSGGVYLTTGGKLLNSYIHHNSSANTLGGGNGGGVYVNQLATVDGCTISNNTAYASGGGINLLAKLGGALVNNCIISNNTSTTGGGGGVNVSNTNTSFTTGLSVTFSNCTISSNIAKTNGGGMNIDVPVTYVSGNSDWQGNTVNILNCIVSSNTTNGTSGSAGNGGGISMSKGNYIIKGCTINNNVSNSLTTIDNNGGGGLFIPYSYGSALNISNSILKGNQIGGGKNVGSAINVDVASMAVKNCLITGNIGTTFHTQGAGRQCTYYNCTIAGNVNATGGEAGLNLGWQVSTISTFTNCLFYKSSTNPLSGTINTGKDPVVTYCGFDVAVPATYANKTGCITGITAGSFTNAASGDWSLSPTSAAIDAGTTIASITTDITGTNLRPKGTAYDMGAYEISFLNTTVTFNAGGAIDSYTNGNVVSRAKGSQLVFMITPDNNKGIKSVLFNGVEVKDQLTDLISSTYYKGGKYTSGPLTETSTLIVEFENDISTALEKVNQFICFSDNQSIKLRGLSIDNQLKVYNVTGTLVLKETANSSNVSIPLAPGLYMVTVVNAGKNYTQKVIVR